MGSSKKTKTVKEEHKTNKCGDSFEKAFKIMKETSEERENSDKKEGDENKLRVTIITNKEPIIDKVDEEGNEINKKVTKKNFCSKIMNICHYLQRERKVSIPCCDWKGKVQCRLVKKVKTFSNQKYYTEKGRSIY